MADESAATKMQSISAFKVFVRAMPEWARRHGGVEPAIIIRGKDGGVEINFSFPASIRALGIEPEKLVSDLIEHLAKEARLMEMEMLVDEFRGVCVPPDVIDPMLVEANGLLRQLHPTGDGVLKSPG